MAGHKRFLAKQFASSSITSYPLKGVVRCRNCGKLMVRRNNGTYSCSGTRQSEYTGCSGSWTEEEIEKAVLAELIRKGKTAAEKLRNT